jgi:hypothetical protein
MQTVLRVLFGCYLMVVAVCVLVIAMDPPWVRPSYGQVHGVFGSMAALVGGAPLSLFGLEFVKSYGPSSSKAQVIFTAVSVGGMVLNAWILGALANLPRFRFWRSAK